MRCVGVAALRRYRSIRAAKGKVRSDPHDSQGQNHTQLPTGDGTVGTPVGTCLCVGACARVCVCVSVEVPSSEVERFPGRRPDRHEIRQAIMRSGRMRGSVLSRNK